MAESYLIADIGATNARFRIINEFEDPRDLVLRTVDYGTSQELLMMAKAELQIENLSGAMLSVAGPVSQDGFSVVLTNSGHLFLAEELEEALLQEPGLVPQGYGRCRDHGHNRHGKASADVQEAGPRRVRRV